MTDNHETAKNVVDAISVGTVVATLAGILPAVAAIFTIVWTAIRIYETDTVQNILKKIKSKKPKSTE